MITHNILDIRNLGIKKGTVLKAVQTRSINGTPEGTEFDLECLGWMGGICDFKRVDTGQTIPWGAVSRRFVALSV